MKLLIPHLFGLLVYLSPVLAQDDGAVEAALNHPTRETSSALFRTCVTEHGEIQPLVERLETIVEAATDDPGRLSGAHLITGYLQWQFGDIKAARTSFDGAVTANPNGLEARLAQATILDAVGEAEEALKAYEALLPDLAGSRQELSVRMTVALLALEEGGEQRKDALAEFAKGLGPNERNRAAVVLALLDRPADALALFQARSKPKERVRDLLRMAGWALQAKEYSAAATHAWEASFLATMARDRWQALALVTEARIADDSLVGLLEWFQERSDLTPQHEKVWTDVLRQTGQFDAAIIRYEGSEGKVISPETRLDLLELYREAGREEEMLAAYGALIAGDPQRVLWRAGLSRVHLEKGNTQLAVATWAGFPGGAEAPNLLSGAQSLAGLGMVDLARSWGEQCEGDPRTQVAAQLFLFALERDGGRVAEAIEVLQRMEATTDPGSPARLELSEAFEQVGALEDAVRVLESVKNTRPDGEAGEDLEMRLAWLYSEIDEEEKALTAWRDLWIRIEALARRRYVEDRMMTVASRLGTLADLAIELEKAVLAGTATEKQSGLLVRLYTRVGDSVSATEVVDEFFRHAGKGERSSLEEKARIYLSTHDYFSYEESVRRLIELDPEGEPDYLRQLAMSMMERGKPRQARDILRRLSELESDTLAAEFEAGVLALAGMRDEALVIYRKGLAEHPGRIDGYLLMGDLLKQAGDQDRALGMFQYLAAHAERDDLFTVAIDGILNQFADGGVRPKTIAWSRRATLMRLALRHDKTYLYQLLADLHEEDKNRVGMIRAHETSLPITGPRVASVLRELMDLSRGEGDTFRGTGWKGDSDLFLHYGRRLVASGELVPPQVYLDLGEAFLDAKDAQAARRTFALTRDMPDHARYQRDAAGLFEKAGEIKIALESYQALLATAPTDESLLVKVGELQEALGRDEQAGELYLRALELLLARRPLVVTKTEEEDSPDSPFIWFGARNTDDWDRWSERIMTGYLAASSPALLGDGIERLMQAQSQDLEAIKALGLDPVDSILAAHPRVQKRGQVLRRFSLALVQVGLADRGDRALIHAFPTDASLAREVVTHRLRAGYPQSARALLRECSPGDDERRVLETLVGLGGDATGSGLGIGVGQAARDVLPYVARGESLRVRDLLQRAEYGQAKKEDLNDLTVLFSAARWLGDSGSMLRVGRQWVRMTMDDGGHFYMVEEVLAQVGRGLDEEGRRALHQYFVGRVVDDPAKYAQLLPVIATLQREMGESMLSEEQVLELLDNSSHFWGLPQLLSMLPAKSRVAALRSKWSKVPVTTRANLLLDLVSAAQEPMGEDMEAFISGHAEEAFRDARDFIRYGLRALGDQTVSRGIALILLDHWIESHPDDAVVDSARVPLLDGLGRTPQALELGLRLYPLLAVGGKEDLWEWRQARTYVTGTLAEDHRAALAASLSELKPSQAFDSHLQLTSGDTDARKALWDSVLTEFPDDKGLLTKALRQVERPNKLLILDRLMELAKKDKEKVRLLKQREQIERTAGFYGSALALRIEWSALETGDELEPEPKTDGMAGMIQIGPNTWTTSGIAVSSSVEKSGKLPASASAVCKALDEGRLEDAVHTLRRHWRQFPTGLATSANMRFMGRYSSSPLANFRWTGKKSKPEKTPDASKEEPTKIVPLGGLEDWKDEVVVKEPKENLGFKALTGEPQLVAELERYLQTTQVGQLDQLQRLVEALALVDEEARGAEAAIGDRVARMVQGKLGKRGQMELLQMLDRHPSDKRGGDVARELVQAVSPKDAAQVRRLARVLARSGAQEEALRLYRWCATRISGQQRFFGFDQDEGTQVTTEELVKEAREVIDEAHRLSLVESVLELSPVSQHQWQREQGELKRLKIWEEMLGPQEALRRARGICDSAIDLDTGLRRRVSLQVASLFAHGRELDHALRALEVGLCKLPVDSVRSPAERWAQVYPEQPGRFTSEAIRRIMDPELLCTGPDAQALRGILEENLLAWLSAERAREADLVMALCVLGLRCEQAADAEGLKRIALALATRETVLEQVPLWVADLCTRAGLIVHTISIEERLLAQGKLHVNRQVFALRRMWESTGATRALEQATACAQHQRVKGLCAFISEVAANTGDEELASVWSDRAVADEAAKTRLKEMDAAAKAAAKAKRTKSGASAMKAMTPAIPLRLIKP